MGRMVGTNLEVLVPATPLYRRIAADLRSDISSGKLSPGDQVPTEQELGDRYKVSRNTVRLALGLLANEGIITSTPGRGTFVRDRAVLTYYASRAEAVDRPATEKGDAYFTEVREQGQQPSQTFEMRIVPASLAVAQRLHVEEGEAVAVRRVIRYVNGEPWSLQDSSYPMDISQECGLLVPHDIPLGTIRAMAEHGHVEIGHLDEITTRMPTPDEARTLDLGAGVPALMYVRTAYTKDRPVRLTETIFAGDRNRLVYELGQLNALYEGDTDGDRASGP
ncbi:MAG: GntR family transcriptional regulator [Egibacteraceae bacterium]